MRIKVSWKMAVLFVFIWFIAASILLDFWPIVRTEGEWQTITNSEYGFSVDYPTKWNARIYGENGFKGGKEIKLRIYRSAVGIFGISVRYQAFNNPNLEDVANWGNRRIEEINEYRLKHDKPLMEEVFLKEDIIREQAILRRRYAQSDYSIEDVYIARSDDMIIITLQAPTDSFESYLDDFNSIVASFRPLE